VVKGFWTVYHMFMKGSVWNTRLNAVLYSPSVRCTPAYTFICTQKATLCSMQFVYFNISVRLSFHTHARTRGYLASILNLYPLALHVFFACPLCGCVKSSSLLNCRVVCLFPRSHSLISLFTFIAIFYFRSIQI
jgi:hypothetical protein